MYGKPYGKPGLKVAPGPADLTVDGKRVLSLPQNLSLENAADIYWDFPADGSIRFVAQDTEGMKRFRIVPN